MLCKYRREEIEKLTDKCENERMARFLCHENKYRNSDTWWISFNKFKNIEYLVKGGFWEVCKMTWINGRYYDRHVLKRIYNSNVRNFWELI